MPAAKPKVQKVCPTCEVIFYVRPSIAEKRRCCSVECQGLWKRSHRVAIECKTCSEVFDVPRSESRRQFCSRKCTKPMYSRLFKGNKLAKGNIPWNKGLTGVKTGKSGLRPHVTPWNYKGGSGSKRHQAMGGLEYKSWRSKVFARDNYTCQICEQYSGVLHADHIKSWSDNEELRYDVNNGRTLCVPCHYYITFKRKMKPGTRWCNFTARKRG